MKQSQPSNNGTKTKIKVLIEATKLVSNDHDGIHRYVKELLFAMAGEIEGHEANWQIDVLIGRGIFFSIIGLKACVAMQRDRSAHRASVESGSRLGVMLHTRDVCTKMVQRHFPQTINRLRNNFHDPLQSFLCDLNPMLKFNNYDVVHLTLPQSHLYFRNCRPRMVMTIHDLTHLHFPQFHLSNNIRNADRGIRLAIEKASEFIAVSNATGKDLLTCHPEVLPGSVHVIHEAADRRRFNPEVRRRPSEAIRRKYGIPEQPFLLALSTIEPRKNLISAIRAFLLMIRERPGLPINFVVAGKMGWLDETVRYIADARPDRLIFTGFVDDSDLAGLYAEAVALVYVSYCEGFGLPPLEAMCCGTPVIYGNNSAMIEVVADSGLAADPFNIEEIKEKYIALATNENLHKTLSKKAVGRSRRFSWQSTAKSTLEVYKTLALKN